MIFSSWNGRSTTSSSMYAPMNAADATFLDDWSMLTIAACSVASHAREPLRCTIGHILAAGDSAHGRRLGEQTCCGWFRSAMACPPRAAPRRRPCLVGTRAGGNYPGKYRAVPGRIPRRVGCAVPCRVGYLDKRERNVLEPVLRAEEIQSEALQRIVCMASGCMRPHVATCRAVLQRLYVTLLQTKYSLTPFSAVCLQQQSQWVRSHQCCAACCH